MELLVGSVGDQGQLSHLFHVVRSHGVLVLIAKIRACEVDDVGNLLVIEPLAERRHAMEARQYHGIWRSPRCRPSMRFEESGWMLMITLSR